jgi:two-component system response regulator AtoC
MALSTIPRILIVEDEQAIRKMLTRAFTKAGYEVLTAAHVSQAINLLREEAVDLVLSDVLLNSLSGHDLARWIAMNSPAVPCILMTGFDDRDCDSCPFASGCIQLRKPLDIKEVLVVAARTIG